MEKTEKGIYVTYVGTSKVAFLKARKKDPNVFEVCALSARLSHGFEEGIVKDLQIASQTLGEAIDEVVGSRERMMIPSRVVVSNAYLKTYTYQSSVYFHGNPHPISLRDVRAAIAQTRSIATIPLQEAIVQAVPQEFLVNDLAGVQNPLGLEASRLGVTIRLLTMDYLAYSNLMKVFERCDIEVLDVIPSVLATASASLSLEEKQSGVILCIIGSKVTHLACYKNSVLIDTSSIPTGADCITEALGKNLNVDYLDAQRLKESFGSAAPKGEFQEELIPIPDKNGKKKYTISRSDFEKHMKSGLSVFFGQIEDGVKHLQERYLPCRQVVFSGGGARLDSFLDVMKETISPLCRIGLAQNVVGPSTLVSDPSFAPLLGSLSFTNKVTEESLLPAERQGWMSRSIEAARNWIFEYL